MKKEELMEQMIQLVRENTDAADISGASSFMDDLEMSSMGPGGGAWHPHSGARVKQSGNTG